MRLCRGGGGAVMHAAVQGCMLLSLLAVGRHSVATVPTCAVIPRLHDGGDGEYSTEWGGGRLHAIHINALSCCRHQDYYVGASVHADFCIL